MSGDPSTTPPTASRAKECEHFFAWVSPAGTSASARLCQFCHLPDVGWLNEIAVLSASLATRSCESCTFGHINPKYPIEEIGVSCTGPLRGNSFQADFYCSKWVSRGTE